MERDKFTVEPNSSYGEVGEARLNQEMGTSERGQKKWIGIVLVAVSLQALLLTAVIVAAGFFSREIVTVYNHIEQLREQVLYMKQQLHQANGTDIWLHLNSTPNSTTISNQLSQLESSVNTFNATTMDPLSNLLSSIDTLNTTTMGQQSRLQSLVDVLTTARNGTDAQVTSLLLSLNALTGQQATTTSQVTSLQSSINNLTSQINSTVSVDIYKGCFEESTNCTLSGTTSDYLRTCRTSSLSIDESVSSVVIQSPNISHACHMYVTCMSPAAINTNLLSSQDSQYYTLDMRCDYRNNWDYIESGDIFKNGNSYFCDCDLTRLSSGSSHATLYTVFPVCTLTVTRCPRTVNILS